MNAIETPQAITRLYAELSATRKEYTECTRRDELFEIKRKLLGRIREIEKQINELNLIEARENKA